MPSLAPTEDTVLNYALMPKQHDFVTDDDHWEILYSGAFGAGKTRALCVRACRLAQYPGARVALCRKTAVDLKATTLVTLLEPDGELPAVLPPNTYHHHKTENRIRIQGGGNIVYFGVDEPTRVASRNLTDMCIDEGIELDEDEYTMLRGRRRGKYKKPDGTWNSQSIAIATNPGAPSHFLYKRFFEEQHEHRRVIQANTAENHHLPASYLQDLSEFTGQNRDRFYLGKWVSFEGAIYWMFDAELHVTQHTGQWDYYVAGVDWGFKNPAVIRIHGCDRATGQSHVEYEYYKPNVLSVDFVQVCVDLDAQYARPNRARLTFVVDPSAADIIAQMQDRGLHVEAPPVRDVQAGIRKVQSALSPASGPLLTMSPDCRSGNREYTAYRWKDRGTKEEPVKELDHALDADRYARTYIESRTGGAVLSPSLARRDGMSRRQSLRM